MEATNVNQDAEPHIRNSQNPQLLRDFLGLRGRLGIFGGSFDPPHLAHLEAAKLALTKLELNAVVFIPARQNPLKETAPKASDAARLEMLLLALAGEPDMYVSSLEYARSGASYTIDTLRLAQAQTGVDTKLFLIVGADCLPDFHLWQDYQTVLQLATLTPVGRPASAEQPVNLGPKTPPEVRSCLANTIPLHLEISSRNIRALAARGESLAGLVHPAVASYIYEHGVYRR